MQNPQPKFSESDVVETRAKITVIKWKKKLARRHPSLGAFAKVVEGSKRGGVGATRCKRKTTGVGGLH